MTQIAQKWPLIHLCKVRDIMYLVASVCPSEFPTFPICAVRPREGGHYQSEAYVCL